MSTPAAKQVNWQPTIPIDQSIYETSTTQKAPLGTKVTVGDRVFHYAKVGAASLPAGDLVCAPLQIASHGADILTPGAAAAGQKVVGFTAGTLGTVNQYQEGYLIISSGTAAKTNLTYRIAKHAAWATAATNASVTLYDDLVAAVTATEEIDLIPNQYNGVIRGSQALGLPVGVLPIDADSATYVWLQTWGPGSVKHEAATAAANAVKLGTTGGVIAAFDATTNGGTAAVNMIVGKNGNLAATAGEGNICYITIKG